MNNDIKKVLTIAGSDCSGGAGIQADIKTMISNGVYAMSAITSLTAQNTTGVTDIVNTTPDFLKSQLEAIFTDIYPDAIKIGMVPNKELVEVVASELKKYKAKHIILDPVMVSTSGSNLIDDEAIEAMKEMLIPMAEIITPNIPEAEILSGMKINSKNDIKGVAKYISKQYNSFVLLKGGHNVSDANDLLCLNSEIKWFTGQRIDSKNTHGTGCTLSSAIASNIAKGMELCEAIEKAKKYISYALTDGLDLGKGNGPLNHGFAIKNEFI